MDETKRKERSHDDDKSKSRSSRDQRDRDAKSRARRNGNDPAAPGAVSGSIGDRDAKKKARAARNGAVTPGAVSAKGDADERSSSKTSSGQSRSSRHRDSDEKKKERARRRGNKASLPGAVAETNDDAREKSRRRKEDRSARLDMTGTIDGGARERYRKLKEKAAIAGPSTTSSSKIDAEKALPSAAALDYNEEDQSYKVEGNLVAPGATPSSAALGAPEEAMAAQADQANKEQKEKPFWCKGSFWVAVLFVLVGGGVAAMFALKQDGAAIATPSDTSSSPPSDHGVGPPIDLNTTQAPQPAVLEPTQSPVALYQPPSEEDCNAIASGSTVSGQQDFSSSEYLVELDVTLASDMGTETWISALNDAFQEKLFPATAGCPTARRLSASRNLQTSLPDSVIANGKVVQSAVSADGCEDGQSENCFRVNMTLSLWLRDANTKMWQVVANLKETLGDTPVAFLALNTQFADLVVIRGSVLSPTEQPSLNPSFKPSVAQTTAPTVAPAAAKSPSPVPSTSPVDSRTNPPTKPPTPASVVGPTPPPTNLPTPSPTRPPTDTPSAFPTSAPVIGPSPPPSPRPTKVPTKAPSPSPTGSPSKIPTKSPTASPTVQASRSPTGLPTSLPSRSPSRTPSAIPSFIPTKMPTGRPTLAFDGQGVPVYGGWDNPGSQSVDVGRYFLFFQSDWEAVFGSVLAANTSYFISVEQRRNDEVIWKGEIRIWTDTVPEDEVAAGFLHGRRNPVSSALDGQWQTGDIIVPRYVSPNIDWRNSWTSTTLANVGWYFYYNTEDFEATFGSVTLPATINAIQCRGGQQVYSGSVRFFENNNGRRGTTTDYGDPGDFEAGDYLLPPNMACPKAIEPPFAQIVISPISLTKRDNSITVNRGTHFSFDNSDWKAVFEFETWGECAEETCVTISRWNDTPDRSLTYWHVRQCRRATEIWSGLVATSVDHWYYPSETGGVGRRNPADNTADQFQVGDILVPYSRNCLVPVET